MIVYQDTLTNCEEITDMKEKVLNRKSPRLREKFTEGLQ